MPKNDYRKVSVIGNAYLIWHSYDDKVSEFIAKIPTSKRNISMRKITVAIRPDTTPLVRELVERFKFEPDEEALKQLK
jgi:hypothetical protein